MKTLFSTKALLWQSMLCGVLLDLALIGASLLLYPSLLQAGRASTALACVVLLLLYASAGIGVPLKARQAVTTALQQGTIIGLAIGIIFSLDLTREYFIDMTDQASTLSTLGFMALIFLLFALAGSRGTYKTRQIHLGLLASIWSAMLGVLIAVLVGFTMNFLFVPRLEHILFSDYVQSGMRDPQAFTFFNSLDSASSHLLEAPILAIIFGCLGSLITKMLISLRAHYRLKRGSDSIGE